MSKELGRFQREIVEVSEFYVDDENVACTNILFKKGLDGKIAFNNPSKYLRNYLGAQGVEVAENIFEEIDSASSESEIETL